MFGLICHSAKLITQESEYILYWLESPLGFQNAVFHTVFEVSSEDNRW